MKINFEFKNPYELQELRMLNPKLLLVFSALNFWCENKKIPLVVTSAIRTEAENKTVGAKSRTHVEGRAIDISVKGWESEDIERAMEFLKDEYYHWGAVSADSGKRNLVIFHNGTAPHLHIQIARNL